MYWNFLFKKMLFYFHYMSKFKFLKLNSASSYVIDKYIDPHPCRGKDIPLVLMQKFVWQNHVCVLSRTANNILTFLCLKKRPYFCWKLGYILVMEAVGERSELASTRQTIFIMVPAHSKAYIFWHSNTWSIYENATFRIFYFLGERGGE